MYFISQMKTASVIPKMKILSNILENDDETENLKKNSTPKFYSIPNIIISYCE